MIFKTVSFCVEEARIGRALTFLFYVASLSLLLTFWFYSIHGSPPSGELKSGLAAQMAVTWEHAAQNSFGLRLLMVAFFLPVFLWLFDDLLFKEQTKAGVPPASAFGTIVSFVFLFLPILGLDFALSLKGVGVALFLLGALLWQALNRRYRFSSVVVFVRTLLILAALFGLLILANRWRMSLAPDKLDLEFLFIRQAGSVAIVLLVVAVTLTMVAALSTTRLTLAVGAVWLASVVATHNLDHVAISEKLPRHFVGQQSSNGSAFTKWVRSRSDLQMYADTGQPYPVILVASEGGGIAATAHAYIALSSLQEALDVELGHSDIKFSDHVFALTGTSGGAVGNSLFWADTYSPRKEIDECKQQELFHFFQTDFLSPLIAALLLEELPRRLLWMPQSDDAGRLRVFERQFATGNHCLSGVPSGPYLKHFWQVLDRPNSDWEITGKPALMPISTGVDEGQSYVFSPFQLLRPIDGNAYEYGYYQDFRWGNIVTQNDGIFIPEPNESRIAPQTLSDVSMLSATMSSAAFPLVTPSVRLTLPPILPHLCEGDRKACKLYSKDKLPEPPRPYGLGVYQGDLLTGYRLLVDGGYSDNTGGSVLHSIEIGGQAISEKNSTTSLPRYEIEDPNKCDVRIVKFDPKLGSNFFFSYKKDDGTCSIPVFNSYLLIGADTSNLNIVQPEDWHKPTKQSFLFDPLKTVLRGRSFVASKSSKEFRQLACRNEGTITCENGLPAMRLRLNSSLISFKRLGLPLGWHLNTDDLEKIVDAASMERCGDEEPPDVCAARTHLKELLRPR